MSDDQNNDQSNDIPITYRCIECGKEFLSKLSLHGHMTSHRPPQACPECGKQYLTPGALGNHRKREHGVVSEGSLQREARKLEKLEQGRPKRGRPRKNQIDFDWTTDDIFNTVIMALWPGGTIPVHAVLPLIQWRETTREFLEKVRSE